ncbi:ABC transporter permease [Algoriphagus chordae]|uniref:Putative permease n=1 Tax=Algoriphagus chordae TaxID=237019 RepID=A0A2W7SKY5_9BACT|nr:ABC transporter permease [Algoriphagus chordae]PZX51332.1 putative permease [Algoriphagus chordae]
MLKNYIKIAWRNLRNNKVFSLINILGLALGMACSLLILLWVQDETNMDKFHENNSRIYKVMENQYYSGIPNTYESTPGVLAENIVLDFPEIELASQILWEEEPLFTVGEVFEKEKGRYVQGDFLNMFSFELSSGDAFTALKRPDGVVISQKLADKYFKGEDPVGQLIIVDNEDDMMVTGVLKEIPESSSLKFDFLMSYERWQDDNEWAKDWGNNGPRCYVMLAPNVDVDVVNEKLKGYILSKNEGSNVEIFLTNFSDSYLNSKWEHGIQTGGRIEYVRIFSVVAIFILIIACVNFMNLATARSVKRAKEIGIRKAVGANRALLIGQFYGEAILITVISLLFSVILVFILLPGFNSLTNKELLLNLMDPSILGILLSLALVTAVLAGSYPALFMSSLKPVVVLKGALKFKPSATYFRKGLVVFQFGLSIILILGMIVIYNQISYIQNKNLGFDRENLIYLPIEGELTKTFTSFKNELLTMPGIQSVAASQADPLQVGSSTSSVSWAGKDTTDILLFSQNPVSYDYLATMGIELLDGRDLDIQYGMDSASYLVNEAAAKTMGFDNPVGEEITFWETKGPIVGLMKDYHYASFHEAIAPIIVRLLPKDEFWGYVLVRTQAGQTSEALASMEKAYNRFNPKFPFTYQFADQEFGNRYKSETTIGSLATYFATLAIFISCLGLFGLAAFTAEQRTKEIGIRKVMGASVNSLVAMLSKDFVVLVLISSVIAMPLAWYFLQGWLENYEYRVDLEWWYFALAVVSAVLIALFTISFQAIKAALINPVRSLKSE